MFTFYTSEDPVRQIHIPSTGGDLGTTNNLLLIYYIKDN